MKTVRTALVFAAVALIGGCTAEPVTRTGIDGIDFTEPPLPAQAATIATDANVSPEPEPDCGDPTASLRPDNAAGGPTLDAIRARGRLVVGLDAGSNLFSFRDPISGAIVGFDADIARRSPVICSAARI